MKTAKRWMITAAILMAAMLCCTAALGEGGNAVLWRADVNENLGYSTSSISTILVAGSRIYCIVNGSENQLICFDPQTGTSESFPMDELYQQYNTYSEDPSRDEIATLYVWQDQIYALISRYEKDEEDGTVQLDGGWSLRLTLENGRPELVESDLPQLDWELMTMGEEDWASARPVRSSFCTGNRLCLLTYDDSYNDCIILYDMSDGSGEELFLQGVYTVAPGPEGQLLTCCYNWEGTEATYDLALYDPETGSSETVSSLSAASGGVQSLYYREETRTLYYTSAGELWAAPDMDLSRAAAVNDCPLESDCRAQGLPDGRILLYNYQAAFLRTTEPADRSGTSLRIMDYSWSQALDNTYYDYTAAHGDVSVIIDRFGSSDDILQAMMNQDSSVDIYCLEMSSGAFSALYNRNYMAPLDASEKLTALADSMYPALSAAIRKNGQLIALPYTASGYTLGYNPDALKKAGISEEELPRTWNDFFTFLSGLPARLEGSGVSVFSQWSTDYAIKDSLFSCIFSDYEAWTVQNGIPGGFDSPVIEEILTRLEQTDYEALGAMSAEETEEGFVNYEWSENACLFEFGVPVTIASYQPDFSPLFLSFDGGDPVSSYTVYCAVINPYSLHVPEAIAFLESLSGRTTILDAYTFSPADNVPVRYPDYEEYKAMLEQTLQDYQDQLAKTEDPEEKAALEESIQSMSEYVASLEDIYWIVSPAAIEAYHARVSMLVPAVYGFNSMLLQSTDSSFYEIRENFINGSITARELLDQLNRKYQMMILEGN